MDSAWRVWRRAPSTPVVRRQHPILLLLSRWLVDR